MLIYRGLRSLRSLSPRACWQRFGNRGTGYAHWPLLTLPSSLRSVIDSRTLCDRAPIGAMNTLFMCVTVNYSLRKLSGILYIPV